MSWIFAGVLADDCIGDAGGGLDVAAASGFYGRVTSGLLSKAPTFSLSWMEQRQRHDDPIGYAVYHLNESQYES